MVAGVTIPVAMSMVMSSCCYAQQGRHIPSCNGLWVHHGSHGSGHLETALLNIVIRTPII